MAEHARARPAAGEHADELDGVDLDTLAVDSSGERAAGGAVEDELEGLAMVRRPFGDDVGDEAAIVVGSDGGKSRGKTPVSERPVVPG